MRLRITKIPRINYANHPITAFSDRQEYADAPLAEGVQNRHNALSFLRQAVLLGRHLRIFGSGDKLFLQQMDYLRRKERETGRENRERLNNK